MALFRLGFTFMAWSIPILWEICLTIDALIYELADQALQAFFEMAILSADIQQFSEEIGFILSRVMVLAGVFALFRVAIMLINYLVDPSKASEVTKNGPTIVKNIVIAIVILMTSDLIFGTLGEFQKLVIEQDVIPKLVYGVDEGENEKTGIKERSTKFVNSVFLVFFRPKGSSGDTTHYNNAYNAVAEGTSGISSLVSYASSGFFEYKPFISGIMGIVLVYYFVTFAIDLGVRIVKLIVLQVISPIPVIMSIDPSQKNKLTNFIKTYSGIYLQVFIRIITLYMAFVVLDLIVDSNLLTDTISTGMLLDGTGFVVQLLLYIGIFHATKEIPKLFEDALGLKLGMPTNKSFGGLVKSIVGGGAGLVGGAVAGGLAGGIGGALVGAGSGVVSGAIGAGATTNGAKGVVDAFKSVSGSVKKAYDKGGRINNAGGLFQYATSGVQNFVGGGRRDAATLKDFDTQIGDIDKAISGHEKNIEGFNKEISGRNELLQTRSQADQLRSGIQSALDQGFAQSDPTGRRRSLEAYKSGDAQLQDLRAGMAQAEAAGAYSGADGIQARQYDLDRIASREMELESLYNSEKDAYVQSQFESYRENLEHSGEDGYVPLEIYSGFEAALIDYNDFVASHGMENRQIKWNEDMDSSATLIESERRNIQSQISEYQSQVASEQSNIDRERANKVAKERAKKDFEKRKDVQARKNRTESNPRVKPRNHD